MTQPSSTPALLDVRLNALIKGCRSDDSQRRFACACARHALFVCALEDHVLTQALEFAICLGSPSPAYTPLDGTAPLAVLRQNVSALVRRLDTEAWDIQAAVDEARAPRLAYERAFGKARAANSVFACLENSAPTAAAEACYEAYHATQDVEALISIGREFLIPESRQDCAGSR